MNGIDRRTLISRAGLLAAGAVGASLLEACGPGTPAGTAPTSAPASGGAPAAGGATAKPAAATGATAATSGKVQLPTYVPFQGPKPDLPGNDQGLDPAFFKFPDPN